MKSQFLKLAGAKDEAEFYKMFPTEEAFMAKHGAKVKKLMQYGGGFGPQNYMGPNQYVGGNNQVQTFGSGINPINYYDYNSPMMSMANMNKFPKPGMDPNEPVFDPSSVIKPYTPSAKDQAKRDIAEGKEIVGGASKAAQDKSFDTGKALETGIGMVDSVVGGLQALKAEKAALKNARIWRDVSGIARKASETVDVDAGNQLADNQKRLRKAMMPSVTGEEFFPVTGVGTNVLARYGGKFQSGGEIQNTYAPEDIYQDLGYEPLGETSYQFEPLDDEEIIKQYRNGGLIPIAQSGFGFNNMMNYMGGTPDQGAFPWSSVGNVGSTIAGAAFDNNAGTQIGGGIGEAAGSLFGPVGGALGKFAGTALGGIFDRNPQKTKKAQDAMMRNVNSMSGMGNLKHFQGGYSGTFEDGGYMSWEYPNPQVITHFGDNSTKALFSHANDDMDTLRSGGNIRSNEVGDIEAVSGGYLEPISYNPYTAGTGITSMIQGQSHDENNGRHSGVILDYNGNQVEAERGEPISERQDGGSVGDTSAVIAGDQTFGKLGSTIIPELKEFEGQKVKKIQEKLALEDAKLNKQQAKNTKALNEFEPVTPIDKLTFNSLAMNEKGTDIRYKTNALKADHLLSYQDAVNKTAGELGVDAGELTRGKVIHVKPGEIAQNGSILTPLSEKEINQEIQRRVLQNPMSLGNPKAVQRMRDELMRQNASFYKPTAKKTTVVPANTVAAKKAVLQNTPPAEVAAKAVPAPTISPRAGKSTPALSRGKAPITPASTTPAQQQATDNYVSEFGLVPWQGNVTPKYGAKTKSSFSGKEWDEIAKNMGFTGKGNKEFQEFLQANPESRKLIDARHQELYGTAPFIDEKLGYGWAADALKGLGKKAGVAATTPTTPDANYDVTKYRNTGLETIAAQVMPWIRRQPGEPLLGDQLAGEMYAMGSNKEEPVQARFYHPQLDVPYDISLQDQLNENQADFNSLQRRVGNNPEALAALAGQKYLANSKVLGEQFRFNQAKKDQVYSGNRATLNDAMLKNLSIADTQYTRQAQAKSNTKEIFKDALDSIAAKIGQNRLENRQLQVGANEFADFSYDKNMRLRKTGAPTTWNIDQMYGPDAGKITHVPMYDQNGKVIGMQQIDSDLASTQPSMSTPGINPNAKSRHGSIVKAFKNL